MSGFGGWLIDGVGALNDNKRDPYSKMLCYFDCVNVNILVVKLL